MENLKNKIALFVSFLFDKKYVDNVTFTLNGSWKPEQWKKRDDLVMLGYTQTDHTWDEFSEYSSYVYSKKIKSTKYYDLTIKALTNG